MSAAIITFPTGEAMAHKSRPRHQQNAHALALPPSLLRKLERLAHRPAALVVIERLADGLLTPMK